MLTPQFVSCRRCREDLTLMYQVKGYSYKYRLYAIQLLLNQNSHEATQFAQLACSLDKSIA